MVTGRQDAASERRDDVANHIKGILNGGFGLIQGMGLTLKHLFEPPITVQYPEERWQPAHGFRGIPVLTVDRDTGELKCVGCQACARACPPQVIHIETSRKEEPEGLILGAIFPVTVPATIMRSACRGDARKIMPKRSKSYLDAPVAIISMAQQARPNSRYHKDDLRAQFTTRSRRVVSTAGR